MLKKKYWDLIDLIDRSDTLVAKFIRSAGAWAARKCAVRSYRNAEKAWGENMSDRKLMDEYDAANEWGRHLFMEQEQLFQVGHIWWFGKR